MTDLKSSFEKQHLPGLFQAMKQVTEGFLFEKVPNEPASASEQELRDYRLRVLIKKVWNMGEKKYYQMPESFRTELSQDEWIQEALVIFTEQARKYDPGKSQYFNRFILKMVKNRLTSKLREFYRKNTLSDDELKNISASLTQQYGRELTPEELSGETGISKEDARAFLNCGIHKKIVQKTRLDELDKASPHADMKTEKSPEEEYILKEARKILRDCIEQLEAGLKLLFMHREFDGFSFEKLYSQFGKILESNSTSTFQRRYKERVFQKVHDCVQKQYGQL